MPKTIIQIYEVQTPEEASALVELGVDHIGSVICTPDDRFDPVIRETVWLVRRLGAVSTLIPLFSEVAMVNETLAYHRPHVVHFCEALDPKDNGRLGRAIALQRAVKKRFPQCKIMRSIPVPTGTSTAREPIFAMAVRLEPETDYFLTDTLFVETKDGDTNDQPVRGFVGITGKTCNWETAAALVARSRIPVILAGGISPENVMAGIRRVRPHGIDSCTCTNALDENGRPIRFRKDRQRVKALVEQTRLVDWAIAEEEKRKTADV